MVNNIVTDNEHLHPVDLLGQRDSRKSSIPDRKKTAESWSLSVDERRTSRRLEVRLPTTIYVQDRMARGMTKSLSLGGLSMTFTGDVPAMLNQQIQLSLIPNTDQLGSLGVVCGIRPSDEVLGSGSVQSGVTLAIQFVRLTAEDEQVVASLFSEGRVRTKAVRIIAALVVQECEEALIDADSQVSVISSPTQVPAKRGSERPREERRRERRMVVGLRTEVSLRLRAGDRCLPAGLTKDLTSSGACVRLSAEENLLGSELELRWTRLSGGSAAMLASTPVATCSVVGEVVWTRAESAEAPSGYAQVMGRTVLAGVRFFSVAKEAEDVIEQLLAQTQRGIVDAGTEGPSVFSEFSECVRSSGARIALCHDRPR